MRNAILPVCSSKVHPNHKRGTLISPLRVDFLIAVTRIYADRNANDRDLRIILGAHPQLERDPVTSSLARYRISQTG